MSLGSYMGWKLRWCSPTGAGVAGLGGVSLGLCYMQGAKVGSQNSESGE